MTRAYVRAIQRYYPQIYLACHADHVRTKSNRHHISANDSSTLAHLDELSPISPGRLARHLGISNSTLSPAIKRLETLGYIRRSPNPKDRRQSDLLLSRLGAQAMCESSVLDSARLLKVLANLPVSAQKQAVEGLALLAGASRKFQFLTPKRTRW